MDDNKILSIVIPVKNNTGTLAHTIQSVLAQSYSAIEVVISNNSLQDGIEEIVDSFDDDRIKYICPDEVTSFSEDWNFALSGATGDYVTFLGDDDAALPCGYEIAMDFLATNPEGAFTWKKLNYNWPDHIVPENRNFIVGDSSNEIIKMKARKALKLFSFFLLGYNQLPCIYNSVVPASAITRIISKTKSRKLFAGVIPDVYSAFAIAGEIEEFFYAYFPLTLNGASNKSSGVLQGLPKLSKRQEELIPDAMDSGNRYHKDIGAFSSSIASIAMGEYLLAKERIDGFVGPSPSWYFYVLYMIREAKTSNKPEEILKSARFTRNKRRMLLPIPKSIRKVQKLLPPAFKGRLRLNQEIIPDVAQASSLLSGICSTSVTHREITFWKLVSSSLNFLKTNALECIRYYLTR